METVEITLPYPPSVNSYKKPGRLIRNKNGGIYQSRVNTNETTRFYYEVWVKIRNMKAQEGLKSFDSATILSLEMDVYPPDRKRRDLDNLCKCTLDSLVKGGLLTDDFQIARLLVQRMDISSPYGKVVVRIGQI